MLGKSSMYGSFHNSTLENTNYSIAKFNNTINTS